MERISVDKEIQYISRVIEKNIEYYNVLNDRGFLSENVLSQLRNLVEDVAILINNKDNNLSLDTHYNNVAKSIDFIKTKSKYKFIVEFYDFLKGSASHYTPSEDGAEKLISFYFRYICLIKKFLKDNYEMCIIKNIEDFPIYDDTFMKENYELICDIVQDTDVEMNFIKGKFYIQDVRAIYSKGNIFYEISLAKATDYTNKFEKITMYSSIYIPDNYSVNISCICKEVKLTIGKLKIQIINAYKIAIRICELKNLFKSIGVEAQFDESYKEYKNLMEYLKNKECTITDILTYNNETYDDIKKILRLGAENHIITDSFDKLRYFIINKLSGHNILRYLTTKLENIVLKDQLSKTTNKVFEYLYFNFKCGMFDSMPYAMSLPKHNISWVHLIKSIDMKDKESQLLYRRVQNNVDNKKMLYNPISEFNEFDNISNLVETYNKKYLSSNKHGKNILVIENGFIYIKDYEDTSLSIIYKFEQFLRNPNKNLRQIINLYKESMIDKSIYSSDKLNVLDNIFKNGNIAFIYGSAGTGKTKMIELLADALKNYNKCFLTVTNAALSNLSSRIRVGNSTFKTINNFKKNCSSNYEILFIDECSMVNNTDIMEVISKQEYEGIVMVGDIYQIESIKYSNWFQLCSKYFKDGIKYELFHTYRTDDSDLLDLWNAVRNNDKKAINILNAKEYTQPLSDKIFEEDIDDEIVLCLNYDGMYGINNINKIRQMSNNSKEFTFGIDTYKIGDKVLFNDCPRFKDFLYNNLKGKIVGIDIDNKVGCWWFTIEVNKSQINCNYCPNDVFIEKGKTEDKVNIIFRVDEFSDKSDDENEYSNIVPFNLAYAISIHKAQGLEYDSVKIVITSNIEDRITKNIFYTAITRSKKKLNIYWTPESQTKIFDSFNDNVSNRDIAIIRQKMKKIS